MWNAIFRARRLRLVLGVKDLGLGVKDLGLGLGLGSFAVICRARVGNILPLLVALPYALRTVNNVSNCIIYHARVAHGMNIALYTALFTVRAHGEYHRAYSIVPTLGHLKHLRTYA